MATTSKASRRPGRRSRREAMLDAATTLFSSRGYAETGIDDIGEAVGVTGPAVYRHFASKDTLLAAVLERAVAHSAAIVPRAEQEATSPEDALDRLIDYTVAECIADRELTAIYWHEARNLPAAQRRRIDRVQRELIEAYAQILRRVRPELTPSEARMAVYAATALMRAVANRESSLSEQALQQLLSSMARAALYGAQPQS